MERLSYDDGDVLVAALLAGKIAAIPTDTVYGLACAAHLRDACERLWRRKGRAPTKPTAIVCGSLERVLESLLPDLPAAARRLLPGAVTVIVPNPERRFAWVCGDAPDRIGLRVPVLDARLAAVIDRVPALLLTSANVAGAPPAQAFTDLGPLADVALDGGTCPGGVPSTVVDLCGLEPVILRPGPVTAAEIAARLR